MGTKIVKAAKDLYQKIKKDPQEYQATINFIELLKTAVTITEEAENEAEEAAKAASGAAASGAASGAAASGAASGAPAPQPTSQPTSQPPAPQPTSQPTSQLPAQPPAPTPAATPAAASGAAASGAAASEAAASAASAVTAAPAASGAAAEKLAEAAKTGIEAGAPAAPAAAEKLAEAEAAKTEAEADVAPASPAAPAEAQNEHITELVQTNLIGVFSYLQTQAGTVPALQALLNIITIIKNSTEKKKIDDLIYKFINIAPEYIEQIYRCFATYDRFLFYEKYYVNTYFKPIRTTIFNRLKKFFLKREFNFNKNTFEEFFSDNNLLKDEYVNDDNEKTTIFKLMTERKNEILIRLSKNKLDSHISENDNHIKIFVINLNENKNNLSYTDVTHTKFIYDSSKSPLWNTRHLQQSINTTPTPKDSFTDILINELKKKPEIKKINDETSTKFALTNIIEHIVSSTLSSYKLLLCEKYLNLITDSKYEDLIKSKLSNHIDLKSNSENDEKYKKILEGESTKIQYNTNEINYNYINFLNDNPVLKQNNMIVRLFYSDTYKSYNDIIVKIINGNPVIYLLQDLYPLIDIISEYDNFHNKLRFLIDGEDITKENIYDILAKNITDNSNINSINNINNKKFEHIETSIDMGQKDRVDKQNYIAYIIIYDPIHYSILYFYYDSSNEFRKVHNEILKTSNLHYKFSQILSEFFSNNFSNKNEIIGYFNFAKKHKLYDTDVKFKWNVDVIMEAIKNN